MLNPATPVEIEALLGDIDPMAIEQILLTAASADEVAAALACVEADLSGEPAPPMSSRVAAVYAIIADAFDDLDDDEEVEPVAAGAF
jgi:hypothetical protein